MSDLRESLVAILAEERFLPRVHHEMLLQLLFRVERFAAMFAREVLLARVVFQVRIKVTRTPEPLITQLTDKGPFPAVNL